MTPSEPQSNPIHPAVVVDAVTFDEFGPVIQHLSVGLLDYIGQLTLITPAPDARKLSLGPVQIISHRPAHWLWGLRDFQSILEELRKNPPDLIHAVSSRSYPLSVRLAFEMKLPLLLHIRSGTDLRIASHLRGKLRPAISTPSEPLYRAAQSLHLADEPLLALIRPGLLTEQSPSCFESPNRVPTLLCMSPFNKSSGVDRLIRAVKTLVDEGQSLMLFLLAQGPWERRLRRLVESEKLIQYVTFAPPPNWSVAIKAADLYVVPAPSDSVDTRLLYALADGIAAVTCAMPNCDFMIHEKTGLICEQPTPAALAENIRRLLKNRPLAQQLARNAIEHCRQYHSLSGMAERTASLYRAILQTHT